jgi:WD40 repeat protein
MGRTSLSWSWDDSEIAYPEAPYSWGPQSAIYALSVHDGSTRVVTQLVKFIEERQRKGERIEDVSAPIQWAHGGERQVVGLTVQVPTGKPQESQPEFRIYIATQAGLSIFRTGWCPAVSPVADQVAYFDDNKVKLANLDGSQERVLTHAPRWLLFFSEDLARAITWSPDGKRLFFHVWISEDFRDKVYLLDVDSGRYAPFLKHTSVMILGWSQAPHSVNPEPLH